MLGRRDPEVNGGVEGGREDEVGYRSNSGWRVEMHGPS